MAKGALGLGQTSQLAILERRAQSDSDGKSLWCSSRQLACCCGDLKKTLLSRITINPLSPRLHPCSVDPRRNTKQHVDDPATRVRELASTRQFRTRLYILRGWARSGGAKTALSEHVESALSAFHAAVRGGSQANSIVVGA